MALIKLPVFVPSVDFVLAIVGVEVVLQQTPLAVIGNPPSEEILPPHNAELVVIFVAKLVVIIGRVAEVVVVMELP